jgi:hypothetical protein
MLDLSHDPYTIIPPRFLDGILAYCLGLRNTNHLVSVHYDEYLIAPNDYNSSHSMTSNFKTGSNELVSLCCEPFRKMYPVNVAII